MSKLFGDTHRQLQRDFDTERLADRIEERLFHEHLTPDDRAFIERMDMFFLATADSAGRPNCSYKGGDSGSSTRQRLELTLNEAACGYQACMDQTTWLS